MKMRINRKRWLPMWTIIALCLFAAVPELATAQEFCWKDSYGRGVGTIPDAGSYGKGCTFITKVPCDSRGGTDMGCFCLISKCPKGKEYDAGLCYEPCKAGYSGVGPVCWSTKPQSWVNCGMGAAKDDGTCASITANQVISVVSLAVTLKNKLSDAADAKDLPKWKEELKRIIAVYNRHKTAFKTAGVIYEDIKLIEQEVVTPEDVARLAAKIAAIVDPTGVADAVAAYTYPKCSSYFPDQYAGAPEGPVKWVDWAYRPDKSQPPSAFIGGWEGDRPQRICRGQQSGDAFPGTWHPGKIYDGKCNFAYGAGRTVVDQYQTLVISAPKDSFIWIPSSYDSSDGGMRQPLGALIGGHQKDRPLRICRAQHENGQHPGKIYEGKCEFAMGSTRIQKTEYQVLVPTPKSLPNGFIKCADEGGICRFNGRVAVFYGDGGSNWKVAVKTSPVDCIASAMGGDGTVSPKSCYIPANARPMLPSGYVTCGKTGETCTFSGTEDVFYGVGERWVKKSTSGSISCGSASFFGIDPAPGVEKACYIPSTSAPGLPSDYVMCAQEDKVDGGGDVKTCKFKGTVNVYFGAGDKWRVRTLTSEAACTKDALGDPAPGVKKACYVPSSAALPGQ